MWGFFPKKQPKTVQGTFVLWLLSAIDSYIEVNNVPLFLVKFPSKLNAVRGQVWNAQYLCLSAARGFLLPNSTVPWLESSYSTLIGHI